MVCRIYFDCYCHLRFHGTKELLVPPRSNNLPFSAGQRTGRLFSMGKRESAIASLSANRIMAKADSLDLADTGAAPIAYCAIDRI